MYGMSDPEYDNFEAGCRRRFPEFYARQERERATTLWIGLAVIGLGLVGLVELIW